MLFARLPLAAARLRAELVVWCLCAQHLARLLLELLRRQCKPVTKALWRVSVVMNRASHCSFDMQLVFLVLADAGILPVAAVVTDVERCAC